MFSRTPTSPSLLPFKITAPSILTETFFSFPRVPDFFVPFVHLSNPEYLWTHNLLRAIRKDRRGRAKLFQFFDTLQLCLISHLPIFSPKLTLKTLPHSLLSFQLIFLFWGLYPDLDQQLQISSFQYLFPISSLKFGMREEGR